MKEEENFSCPRCVSLLTNSAKLVPLKSLKLRVDVHLSVAFVEVEGIFQVVDASDEGTEACSFVYQFPTQHQTTVTNAVIFLENKQVFEAIVVEDTPGMNGYKCREGAGMAAAMKRYRQHFGKDLAQFDPELFSLPFHGSKVGEEVKVVIKYIQNMQFYNGEFFLSIPLRFPQQHFTKGFEDSITVEYQVSTIPGSTAQLICGSRTHEVIPVEKTENAAENTTVRYQRDKTKPWKNDNLLLFYSAGDVEGILTSALFRKGLKDPLAKGNSSEGVLSLFIAPPRSVEKLKPQPKDVIFVLDRSGSMGFSDVMESAKSALKEGLSELLPHDRFAICAFDDRQAWFAGALPEPSESDMDQLLAKLSKQNKVNAKPVERALKDSASQAKLNTPEEVELVGDAPQLQTITRQRSALLTASPRNLEKSKVWVDGISPGGLTDILTPLKQATFALHAHTTAEEFEVGINSDRVAMVFVITDGAVDNERQICQFGQTIAGSTRIFTFGIGSDCNSYFLRKLASIGRGYTDVCLVSSNTQRQMSALIRHAQLPVLTDISVDLSYESISTASWTPKRTPDLFYNAPIMISMKYTGELSTDTKLSIKGKLSGQSNVVIEWNREIGVKETKEIPLNKVFAQQHVQELVADSWLADLNLPEGQALRKKAVQVAVEEGISCPFTKTVAVETNLAEFTERKAQEDSAISKGLKPPPIELKRFKGGVVFLGALGLTVAFGSITATVMAGASGADGAGAAAVDGDCCCCEGCEECLLCDCAA